MRYSSPAIIASIGIICGAVITIVYRQPDGLALSTTSVASYFSFLRSDDKP